MTKSKVCELLQDFVHYIDNRDYNLLNRELIDFAKSEIQDVLMNVRSVNYVMLCSTDGFELAHVYKRDGYNSTKLAAVSSSILAMVAAFMNEIHLEGCQSITLDADNGMPF